MTQDPLAASLPTSDSTSIVATNALSVRYGEQLVLQEVSLAAQKGEVLAIVGPSGCGKSTLLSTFNRLSDLAATCHVTGEVFLAGESIFAPQYDVFALRRRVGMVFQKANPFPLSIRQNLALPLREHGTPRSDIGPRSERALRRVGLWNEVETRLDSSANKLSGGQQQRLCIARALALDPEVLLMDEPCSALDPQATAVIEELIHDLKGEVTVILVTHNLAQAERVSDRMAVFWTQQGSGRLIETGPTADMFNAPSHEITADYLSGRRG